MKPTTKPRCTRCGEPLLSGTLGDRCLRCLLELGLASGEDDAPDEAMDLAGPPEVGGAGTRFGDYELLEEIGRGGMGVVYRARQVSLDRIVALKMLVHRPFETPELAERLEAEARAAAGLHHPGIVAIHEFGQHDGQFFFSMEYIEGRSLADVIADSPGQTKDFERAARYLRDIAGAVHYAHEQGILHRDLKPSNILVEVTDAVKVTDFGLAKRIGTDSGLTLTGQVLGSPSYLSPEQAAGRRDQLSPRSDVYALGAVLFELLTGRPPFVADSFESSLVQIRENEAPSPRLLNPRVPRDLETICLKCLEKEPERRYASARELGEDLGRFLNREPIRARPISPVGRVWRWSRRKPALAGLSAAVLVLFLTILIGLPIALVRISRALDRAESQEYASNLSLAQAALDNGVQGTARQFLQACLPESGQPDRRGWEWHYLWNQCVDDALESNRDKPDAVLSIALNPAGDEFVVSRRHGSIELWRWDPLKCVKVLRPRVPGLFTFAAFSPMGDRFATGERGAVKIWQLPEGGVVRTLPNDAWAYAIAFSHDGRRIACLDNNGFRTWGIDQPVDPYVGIDYRGNFYCRGLAFHPDGRLLAFGDPTGKVRILQAENGEVVEEFEAHGKGVACLAYSPDGRLLATAARSRAEPIKLWDGQTGELWGELPSQGEVLQALAFTDNDRLVAAGHDQSVRIWDLESRECSAVLHGVENTIFTLAVAHSRERVLTGDWDGVLAVWPTSPTTPPTNPTLIPEVSGFGLLTEDGRRVVVSDRMGRIIIWETRPVRQVLSLDALGEGNYGFDVSIEKGLAAFSNVSGRLSVWSVARQDFVTNFVYHVPTNSTSALLFIDGGSRLAAGRTHHPAIAWGTDTWRPVRSGDPLLQILQRIIQETQSDTMVPGGWKVSRDGRLMFVYDDNGSSHWFDLRSGRKLRQFHDEHTMAATAVALSPDDRLAASVSTDSSIVIRNIRTRQLVCSWRANNRPISSAAFSPDGRRFVTAHSQGYGLTIWDWATQRSLITIPCDAEGIEQVEFSQDGHRLFALGDDTLYIWDTPAGSGAANGE